MTERRNTVERQLIFSAKNIRCAEISIVERRGVPYHTVHDITGINFYMIKKVSYRDINDIVT